MVSPGLFREVWIDPADPARILAAAIGVGLFSSIDGGLTFAPLSSPRAVELLSLSGNASRLYLGSDTGPWVSTDGGATFSEASAGLQAGRFTAVAVSRPPAAWCWPARTRSVLRSTDGGVSWTSVLFMPSQAPLQIAFDPRTPARVYLVNWGDLMVSTDAGATWNYVVGSHLTGSTAWPSAAAPPPRSGSATGTRTGVWRSPDAGATSRSRVYARSSASVGFPASRAMPPIGDRVHEPARLRLGRGGDRDLPDRQERRGDLDQARQPVLRAHPGGRAGERRSSGS